MSIQTRHISSNLIQQALMTHGQSVVGNLVITPQSKSISFEPYFEELDQDNVAKTLSILKGVVPNDYIISVFSTGVNIDGLDEVNGHMLNTGEVRVVIDNYTGSEAMVVTQH